MAEKPEVMKIEIQLSCGHRRAVNPYLNEHDDWILEDIESEPPGAKHSADDLPPNTVADCDECCYILCHVAGVRTYVDFHNGIQAHKRYVDPEVLIKGFLGDIDRPRFGNWCEKVTLCNDHANLLKMLDPGNTLPTGCDYPQCPERG